MIKGKLVIWVNTVSSRWLVIIKTKPFNLMPNADYKTRASALRAAKRVAKKLGITLEVER
jgi:hypothetical protein